MNRWVLLLWLLVPIAAILVYLQYEQSLSAPENAAEASHINNAPWVRGAPATDFDLPDLSGKRVHRTDFKNKVLVVNFWATWCGPCRIEMPWLIEFQKKYGPDGLAVVAISLDAQGPDVVQPYVSQHGMESLTVVMGNGKTANLFGGLLGLPTTFIVDRDGKYYAKHQGVFRRQVVEDELLGLLGIGAQDSASAFLPGTQSTGIVGTY